MLNKNLELSRYCRPYYSSHDIYEVDWGSNVNYVVNLNGKTCTCGSFQLYGIYCPHACSAILNAKKNPELYMDDCYTKKTYLKAYALPIGAMPSKDHWGEAKGKPLKTLEIKRQPERPKMKRIKSADETKTASTSTRRGLTVNCQHCGVQGHNVKTCKGPINPSSPYHVPPENECLLQGKKTPSNPQEYQWGKLSEGPPSFANVLKAINARKMQLQK
ncbi:OLC1v1030628C1 [Oldenlandia corymbosa var. corymbosa]|uniref:OLC1v1030628C1 n=1 Tax=Oldenlandia corymbosa var. corymbosa TaxID=529605 RepID=A0AAV1CJH5_OLDCO|nr:OLC1v1030628C1 [Oldenlandia corymbosa var. corymbosa]